MERIIETRRNRRVSVIRNSGYTEWSEGTVNVNVSGFGVNTTYTRLDHDEVRKLVAALQEAIGEEPAPKRPEPVSFFSEKAGIKAPTGPKYRGLSFDVALADVVKSGDDGAVRIIYGLVPWARLTPNAPVPPPQPYTVEMLNNG